VRRTAVTTFSKTISESDVYLFAGITGDLSPVHVNEARMAESEIGSRIAHGILVAGLMSAGSARWVADNCPDEVVLSYGYDRMRFVCPVRFGDTITIRVSFCDERDEGHQLVCDVEASNQHNQVVAVAQHLPSRRLS
jgi:acyl dehydratase